MTSNTKMSDFTTLNKLGSGAFSEVYKVQRKSDRKEYALKKVKLAKLTTKEKDNAINEVRILASINHENIAGYKEAFFEQGSSSLCIVMEYADGGDLQTKINQHKKTMMHMKEEYIWSIFYQMVSGLFALHKKKIVHRDIKCANVFLTKKGTVKLGDLNVSKIAKAGVMQTQTGTPYYASPEVWKDQPYDKSSDIWSLGAVLYEMVALSPPFQAKDMKGLYNKVVKGVYPAIPKTFTSDLASMIANLLKVDPKKRPSAEQILHMPVFIAKYNERRSSGNFGEEAKELIGTIRVPKNLSLLTERLPASQYEQPIVEEDMFDRLQPNLPQIEEFVPNGQDYIPLVAAKRQPLSNEKLKNRVVSGAVRNARHLSGIDQANINRRPSAQVALGGARGAQYASGNSQRDNNMDQQSRNADSRIDGGNNRSELLHVQPYQKKYLQGVPGSSPVIRAGDDLNFEQKYGKGPLMERAERLKRLQELRSNMHVRASERGESDDGAIRIIRDNRMKRVSMDEYGVGGSRRAPNSNMDVIHMHKEADVAQLYRDDIDQQSNLPRIAASQVKPVRNRDSGLPPMPTPSAKGSRFIKPSLAQIYAPSGRNDGRLQEVTNSLSRARSKDHIHSMETPMRNNRYGAGAIIEAGRQESQRLLMERYRRIDVSDPAQKAYPPKFVRPNDGNNYYSQIGGGSLPPSQQSQYQGAAPSVDQSRLYIPMSQKGQRPTQYTAASGVERQINAAMARKIMNNQPSSRGGAQGAGAHHQIQGGGVSRPSWWG